jgi:hypothetical protein
MKPAEESHVQRFCARPDAFSRSVANRWRYRAFQFDPNGQLYPHMKGVLTRLAGLNAWDQLSWFLAAHEALKGQTPLNLWSISRDAVVRHAGRLQRPPPASKRRGRYAD